MSEEAEAKAFNEWCPWGKLTQVRKGAKAAWGQLYPEIAVRDSIIKARNIELQRSEQALEMESHLRKLAVVELEELRPLAAELQRRAEQIKSMQKNMQRNYEQKDDAIHTLHIQKLEAETKLQKMMDQIKQLLLLLKESKVMTTTDVEVLLGEVK